MQANVTMSLLSFITEKYEFLIKIVKNTDIMVKLIAFIPHYEWCGLLSQGKFNKSEIAAALIVFARNSLIYADWSFCSQARPRIG